MLSHAHAFRHGFALPKAALQAVRALRGKRTDATEAAIARFDARQREDLGLTPAGLAKTTRDKG